MKEQNHSAIPRIKVCGVTRVEELDSIATAGVDTVGINLVPHSPRCVDLQRAQCLSEEASRVGLLRVAVFMDPSPRELDRILTDLEVDFVQLHGTESPDWARCCHGIDIIKAISWSGRSVEVELASAWLHFEQSRQAKLNVHSHALEETETESSVEDFPEHPVSALRAFLVDAHAPGIGGGTGKRAAWDLLQPRPAVMGDLPMILAGGIGPENVGQAIEQTKPDGVDTASGVESSPGVKDVLRVRAFASNAESLWG